MSLPQFPIVQQPLTVTPNPMDNDDNNPVSPNDHHQPVNLLTLQQEIIQQTTSIQTFFTSLVPLTKDTLHSNNNSDSNGCKHAETLSDNLTMVTNSNMECLTLHQHLNHLTTTECFILACILHGLALTRSQLCSCMQQLALMMHNSTVWQVLDNYSKQKINQY